MLSKKLFTRANFKQGAKDVIKGFDMYSRPANFNYKGQPDYQTLTGGMCSIVLIIAFIIVFSTTLLGTFGKQFIEFRESKCISDDPTPYNLTLQQTFMFAIGIRDVDLNVGKRYFHIYMENRIYNGSQSFRKKIPLKPCQQSDWEAFQYGDLFDSMDLEQYLCPEHPQELKLEFQGKHSSQIFKFYKIGVRKCENYQDFSRPCANQAEIEEFLKQQESFSFNFYFINALINPSEHQYFKTYFEDSNQIFFSPQDGVEANLFVSEYEIDTDTSLSPFQDHEIIEGAIVLDKATISPYRVRKDEYMRLYIKKSPISINVQRSYRKVDDTLSYIGGLFSFLLMFFGFISIYNEFSFEIDVTKNNYKDQKQENGFDAKFFNLYTFFWYLIYLALQKIGYEPNWQKYKNMHNYLQTARKQLDITYQLKKSQFNQKLWMCLLEQYQLKALMMSGPLPLKDAQKIYNYLDMHKQLKKKYFPKGEWIENKNEDENQQSSNKLLGNVEQELTDDSDEGQNSKSQDKKEKQSNDEIVEGIPLQNGQEKQQQSNIQIQVEGILVNVNDPVIERQETKQEQQQQDETIRLQEVKKVIKELKINKDKLSIKIMQRIDPIISKKFIVKQQSAIQLKQQNAIPRQLRDNNNISQQISQQSQIQL